MHQRSLTEINLLTRAEFIGFIGPVFEHSPWIAGRTWPQRPFRSAEQLHRQLCETVGAAVPEEQLALIRAHPDLAGRLAQAGALTPESTQEQAGAGLDQLTAAELAWFQENNARYQAQFGFPFVICARLNKKEALINGFRLRLNHAREEEIKTALEEIFKIAELRLRDLIAD